jgi:nucleoid-associated protein YgaU
LACATAILPAERTVAADSEPVASGSPQPPDYQRKVAKEAEELRPSEVAEEGDADAPPTADSGSSATSNRDRLDQVKAAVREALGEPPSDTNPVDARRQQLRELVVNSPVPEDLKEDRYVGELRDEVSQTIVVQGATATAMEKSAPDDMSTATEGPESYQVRPGDSLWKVAEALLGDGHKWPAIYEANRESLKNVDVLLVGQRLRIPDR